ncbi:peptide/nickel transport system ATP-binding protein [Nocardioides aromaticivorans]|uniref:Peptide/nickel transport system ATP-binding protein n=1 Tax=Nocardioides aromaticivorans TaxID=200618 RepID=A0A7Z0CLU2_9ACTN|nr:ABC transporter ATP-binding protein [Nocardioides aromaticivorans]NYI43140.1 peptide/nickel transport system ATP-binding protein [Nocardioides aromaticivorans]
MSIVETNTPAGTTPATAVAPTARAVEGPAAPVPLLEVEGLRVSFAGREVVKGISFTAHAGRCLAIVGESGSGKSVTARTLVGLTGPGAQVEADRLELGPHDLTSLRERQWRRIRGKEVGFVLQDALVSLDQLRKVGHEVAEPLAVHKVGDRRSRAAKAIELLRAVGVPEPEVRAAQRPYELSGGLRQRALIASAIALDPPLVIADEPTTALDVTVGAQVLDLLAESKARGTSIILISHDLAVVARLADDVAVMQGGVLVEHGPVEEILQRPQHPYTQALLDAVPSEHTRGTRLVRPADGEEKPARTRRPIDRGRPLIEARHLVKAFRGPDGKDREVVRDVSFEVFGGETLGIVGESGSGKTTTARIALALTAPTSGEVLLRGEPWSSLSPRQRRPERSRIGVVYQDPLSSFDPRWSVARILADALSRGPNPPESSREARSRSRALLEQVGLGAEHLNAAPLRLSGGQRQRVAIARALAPEPDLIVCDEPVSALDVSVQAQVLDLLTDLQDELGVTYLFISHDLGVIHHMCDRVLVMKDGEVVESGTADDVFERPQHPYTQQLLTALPRLETTR